MASLYKLVQHSFNLSIYKLLQFYISDTYVSAAQLDAAET